MWIWVNSREQNGDTGMEREREKKGVGRGVMKGEGNELCMRLRMKKIGKMYVQSSSLFIILFVILKC